MKNLLLDLWHDLREKRLWPVAAALLVGLIAVPAVLLKPAATAPAPALPPASERAAGELPELKELTVVADTAASRGGSTLDVFDAKDPFRPPAVVLDAQKDKLASTATAVGATQPAGGGTAKGGSAPGGSGGSGGGGAQGGPAPTSPVPVTPAPRRAYAFVADVYFGRSGRERRYRTLNKLGLLPSQELPLLIFLGVDPAGNNAVFLVDSMLNAAGEGHCSPNPSECATLTIGAGSEHEFVDEEGRSYTLRINEIRQVGLSKASASTRRTSRGPRASIAVKRRFVPPVLADLVTVASPGPGRSSTDGHSR